MTLKEIAYRNLIRRRAKAAFILAGLTIGVATVVAVIAFGEAISTDINRKLEKYGANILIVPQTDNLTLSYGGLSLGGFAIDVQEIRQNQLDQLHTIKNARNIAAVGPMVLGAVDIGSNRVLLAGVDFEVSSILKPWWKIRGDTPRRDQIVLGSEAARVLMLDRGDNVFLNGTRLNVAGVLRTTGSQDDQLIFAPLETAQDLLDKKGVVSMVEVAALCEACPVTDMVAQISQVVPGAKVMAIQQVVKGRMQTMAQFKKFSYGISAVVVLIGTLVVLVTMMGSVRERTREIGIFRAVGFRKGHVMQIVFMETGIISALAGIVGYLTGLVAARIILVWVSANQTAAIRMDAQMALGALAPSVTVGMLASIYPALMAARLDPNQALRAI